MTDGEVDAVEPMAQHPRWKLALVLTPIVIAVVASYISAGFFPKLVKDHPIALLALNARSRNIVLVAGQLAFLPVLIVSLARRLVLDPFFFALGRMYGTNGVRWVEKKIVGAGDTVRFIEKWFHKVGWLFVMLYAGEIVCTLAGATGMSLAAFIFFDFLGTVLLIGGAYYFSGAFSGPVGGITDFIGRFSLPLTILTLLMTAYVIWNATRTGKTGGIETVGTFEKELQSPDAESESPNP